MCYIDAKRIIYLDISHPMVKNCGLFYGGVPERSKGSDCKSDGSAFEGSNPSPSTIFLNAGVVQR